VLSSEYFTGEEEKDLIHSAGVVAADSLLALASGYGFNGMYTAVLDSISDEMADTFEFECLSPDTRTSADRRCRRTEIENRLFDAHRYLGDLEDAESDYLYMSALSYVAFWNTQWKIFKNAEKETDRKLRTFEWLQGTQEKSFIDAGGFNATDEDLLKTAFKKKEYLLDSTQQISAVLTLLDVLYAYCYDCRMTQGEFNVESCHNITRLSSSLSWLEGYCHEGDSIEYVVLTSMRRSLVYPYCRNWKLSVKVLSDVVRVLHLGKRTILKCVLTLRSLFEHTDTHYLLNTIFIDDFCVWI
jgi:protein SHQ1